MRERAATLMSVDDGTRPGRLGEERDDPARLGGGRRRRHRDGHRPAAPKAWPRAKPSACGSTRQLLGLLAGLYIDVGNPGEALQLLDEALARADRLEELVRGGAAAAKGEALLAFSPAHLAEAEACYRQALDVALARAPVFGSCAPRPASPGYGAIAASARRRATCSRRSTTGSPKASIPPISRAPSVLDELA